MNNKIPCGGFYLSDTLGVDENGKLGVNGGEPYKSLVTDGEGGVKWEDRLAYVATEEQAIFSQEDIAFTEQLGLYASDSMPITALSSGEKVRVDFDGETYDCIVSVPIEDTIFIGNLSLFNLGDDTGEPFVIDYTPEPTTIAITTNLTNPTHTVSISRVVETVHKIPQVYLPEKTKVYVVKSVDGMYFDSERTKKLSAEDFISAVNSVGIDFIDLSDYQKEEHPQLVNYQINKNTGELIAFIAYPNSDGTALSILGRRAKPASFDS